MFRNIEGEFHFPEEIKSLINGIKKEKQWNILELLINNNNELSYTELREQLGLDLDDKGDLNYHLNNLESSGWLRNIVKQGQDLADRFSSFYTVTKFGLKALEGAMQAMNLESYQEDPLTQLKDQSYQIGLLGIAAQTVRTHSTLTLDPSLKNNPANVQFTLGEIPSGVSFVINDVYGTPASSETTLDQIAPLSESIRGKEGEMENEPLLMSGYQKRKRM